MESAKGKMNNIWVIRQVEVVKVEELFIEKWVSGVGKEASFEKASRGWFTTLTGSYAAIWLGATKPELNRGDYVTIIIRKEPKSA